MGALCRRPADFKLILAVLAIGCGSTDNPQGETPDDVAGSAGAPSSGAVGGGAGDTSVQNEGPGGARLGGVAGQGGHAGTPLGGSAGRGGSAGSGGNAGSSGSAGGAGSSNGGGYTGALKPGVWQNITPSQIDPSAHACTDLQFDPSNPSTLYGFYGDGGGLWKSTNAGATWTQIGNFPMPNSLGRILIDPKNPMHMYATGSVSGNSLGFWVSQDGGNTWAIPAAFKAGAGTTWIYDVYNIVADPTDFSHFLLTFHNGWPCCGNNAGVVESNDGGDSYIVHAPPPGMDHGQGIAFLYNPARGLGDKKTWLVGAGYGAGIYRTSDAGNTWNQVSPAQENHGGFDAHYSSQGFLFVGAIGGVERSTDNGLTWQQETQGLNGDPKYYSVIGDGSFLYTSESFVGVAYNQPMFVSPEGGPTEGQKWSAYSAQTIADGPWKMVFDPTNRIIYNATWSAGAWALKVVQ